jgi:hypothetical protein
VLTVYGNVAGGQATVALSGVATAAAAVVLNPVVVNFPATTIGATSGVQNVTVSNTGGTSVGVQTLSVTGDFAVAANTCGPTLGPGVGCTVAIGFTPTASGTRTGSLTVVDDLGTQSATLSGVGTSPATDTLSPLSLSFSAQQLGTTSGVQQVTLTNVGDVALTLISAQITTGDFSVVNGCGNSLNARSSCSIGVVFQPRSVGPGTGVLTVADEFRSQSVALSGVGVAPAGVSLSPTSGLSFGATGVGGRSAPQVITLANNGGLPLQLQGVSPTGDFAVVAGSDSCGAVLAVSTACSMQVVFAPVAGGVRNGTLTVTDNALNSPQTMQLVGTGVDFSLTADGSTSVTIASGKNAVYPLLLTPVAGESGSVSFSCSGVPANATCNVSPATVDLAATTVVSVTLNTGAATAATSFRGRLVWLGVLVPFGWLGWRRRGLMKLVSVGVVCALMVMSGCGSGRKIPGDSGVPGSPTTLTPAGTYGLVVTAASAGVNRTVNLTLVVQ